MSSNPNAPSEPTDDQLRLAIRTRLKDHPNPAIRQYADDPEYIDLRLQATRRLASNLKRSGLQPHEAWDQAMREEALA